MKLVLLIIIAFLNMGTDASQKCFGRREKKMLQKLHNKMGCEKPMKQLVPVTPPLGYNDVFPSMTEANRCNGLICHGMNKRCMPTEVINKTVKVAAEMANGSGKKCMEVDVEEHVTCGCRCSMSQEQCKGEEVLDERKCQCACPKEATKKCHDKGSRFMWDVITCSCQCTPQTCPANAFFIHETCRCMTNTD